MLKGRIRKNLKYRLRQSTRNGHKRVRHSTKRLLLKKFKRAGVHKHNAVMKRHAIQNGKIFKFQKPKPFERKRGRMPELPRNIKFLASVPELFSKNHYSREDDGYFYVPECFSLLENYEVSFDFLKRLYVVLYKAKVKEVYLDYSRCKRIDVDASICMDVMLADFIRHLNQCWSTGHNRLPKLIRPINFDNPDIRNVLFSIGAFKNIMGVSIPNPEGVEPLPVLVNSQNSPEIWKNSEVHLTEIVEYIKLCLKRLGRELTTDAETEFYKVIGEVMSNAEEHATMPHRFAIGYFKEDHNEQDEVYGILNFSIFNFGRTIYETFKSPDCPNKRAVQEMTELSESFTKKGWFTKAEFEEETLWTLYALQDGVTSKPKRRGNGSMHFINNFYRLKGTPEQDDASKLVILSGNTRILFDGKYDIVEKHKPGEKLPYKMITFNKEGDITMQPDKNYVTFAPYFFPGTLISARILIKSQNLAQI